MYILYQRRKSVLNAVGHRNLTPTLQKLSLPISKPVNCISTSNDCSKSNNRTMLLKVAEEMAETQCRNIRLQLGGSGHGKREAGNEGREEGEKGKEEG